MWMYRIMRMFAQLVCVLVVFLSVVMAEGREKQCFDYGWRFLQRDANGGELPDFDDTTWRELDLPHDWSIEGKFHGGGAGGKRGGYVDLGVGWYRKTFEVSAEHKSKKLFVEFGGVYKDSDVWLNGKHLGKRWYGYATFQYDLTPHINWDGENVLAVKVNNPKQTCRWYSGSGIYRHVWLTVTDKLAVGHWGTFVTTPAVSVNSAIVSVETTVTNGYDSAQGCVLSTDILNAKGKAVASVTSEFKLDATGSHTFRQEMTVKKPALWSADHPNLYTAKTTVRSGRKVVDEVTTSFGIREIGWSADKGFEINGESVILNGVNLHHDLGSLGAAFNARAMERRLEILKKMGCNAIRTAHNPPASELLDMCDRMGFYVIDEAFDKWGSHRYATFEADWQKDLLAMILRDRNHPCIVLWSVGNENWAPRENQRKQIYTDMTTLARQYDATRKFTYALSPGNFIADARLMDVASLNYQEHAFEAYRKGAPDMVIISSETYAYWRGKEGNAQAYYPMNPWLDAYKLPYVAGSFIWTGIDYLGEAMAGWPFHGWNCTPIDTCGIQRPVSYLHESFWSDKPMVHIAVLHEALKVQRPVKAHWHWPKMVSHWTLPELKGQNVKVSTFSNCDEVELVVNGSSLGRKNLADFEDRMITWDAVPYVAGTVTAIGYKAGKKACSHELKTAGEAKRIELVPDRRTVTADGRDLSHVEVRIVDAAGVRVPDASQRVAFEVSGAGRLRAMDNGDLTCEESYGSKSRPAFLGRCMAIVQAGREPGKISLTATAEGLPPAAVTIRSER